MSSLTSGQKAYHGKFFMAILNGDLLHGTMHHPAKFEADSWNP